MTITVNNVNNASIADTGDKQTVDEGDTVQLNGSGSSDVDGDALTYSWSFASRPSGSSASLSNAATATPFFTADVGSDFMAMLVIFLKIGCEKA